MLIGNSNQMPTFWSPFLAGSNLATTMALRTARSISAEPEPCTTIGLPTHPSSVMKMRTNTVSLAPTSP